MEVSFQKEMVNSDHPHWCSLSLSVCLRHTHNAIMLLLGKKQVIYLYKKNFFNFIYIKKQVMLSVIASGRSPWEK